jgi:signal transduction histidine kinase/CheY-like chemotaxis protein
MVSDVMQGESKVQPLQVGLVGAGRRGAALLQLFASAPTVRVVAVVDPNPEAAGLPLARAQGIPVLSSNREIFAYAPQILIEVTGRPEVLEELTRAKPVDVEVVGTQSARLFFEIVTLRAREAQRLERAETVRRMTGGVFHSLNNIFASLLGRTQLLLGSLERDRWTREQLTEGLQSIAGSITRGSEILKRLRGLVREPAGKPVTRVEVNDLVREVVALADPLIREAQGRSAPIEVRQELEEVPQVVARPSELLEVLLNLIVNAVEAMPEGGTLSLETTRDGPQVLVRVRDTGIGIPDAVKGQLFTPFFTTKAGGTGLGLSVSREIVLRHGGDLAVESTEGKGTCVSVGLPVAEVGRGVEGAPARDLRGWRVLVVDDDPFVREVVGQLLAMEGCQVRDAAGGEEALACLRRQHYDLVLVDVVMPDMPGWQVARAARAQEPAPVVILFTGWRIEPDDPSLRESGADAFLRKPIRLPELIEAVRRVLAKRTPPSG